MAVFFVAFETVSSRPPPPNVLDAVGLRKVFGGYEMSADDTVDAGKHLDRAFHNKLLWYSLVRVEDENDGTQAESNPGRPPSDTERP